VSTQFFLLLHLLEVVLAVGMQTLLQAMPGVLEALVEAKERALQQAGAALEILRLLPLLKETTVELFPLLMALVLEGEAQELLGAMALEHMQMDWVVMGGTERRRLFLGLL
jgi:nucleotide-binding universal stress UspA family protein